MSLTRGRPRKPEALKRAQGTQRKDRTNKRAPKLKRGEIPPAPDHLSERQRRGWRYLKTLVDPLKVYTAADVLAFEELVKSWAILNEAHEELGKAKGLTYEQDTQSGTVERRRPQVDVIKEFKKILLVELSRFGMTPADRERVSAIGDDDKGDPLDEFAVGANATRH